MLANRLLRQAALCLLLLPVFGLAQADGPAPALSVELEARLVQLEHIHHTLKEMQQRADQLRRELAETEGEARREELQAQLDQLETQRRSLSATFQRLALVGVDLSAFEERPEQREFNWQNELLGILRPLFYELRQLTEQPRAMEQLRSERALLTQRLQAANQALANLEGIPADGLNEATAARLEELEQQWRDRQAQLLQQRAAVQLQIDNQQQHDSSIYEQVRRAFGEFLVGRGLTLAIAMLAFALVLGVLLGGLNRWLSYRARQGRTLPNAHARMILLGYRLFSGLLAVMIFLMVLYAAGDAVLLALSLVVLVALLLSFRTYLPRYVNEARLFLNAGQVREQERVIYRGLPWEVASIGLHAKLTNPELENGTLRLPLREISDLISRPVANAEPWFPCRAGEWVLLSDETFGLVERQTPELVQLRVRNNSVLYATTDFLALRPRNLSRGSYVLAVTFGIDYRHQAIATSEVPEALTLALTRSLGGSSLAPHVHSVQVDFKEAGASSLDYLVVVTVDGAAADAYFKAGRLVQTACVEACNANGWVIPFNQLTIHRGEGFGLLDSPRQEPLQAAPPVPA